jgi:hypothetical protein
VTRVPAPALALGYLGLLPFIYAAALLFVTPGTLPTLGLVPSDPAGGALILERFGAVILGFMGGCLWGFACARPGGPTLAYLFASIVPAAIAFLALGVAPAAGCLGLAFGFVLLQAVDVAFHREGIVPDWWLGLRLPLTGGVLLCLLAGALHG